MIREVIRETLPQLLEAPEVKTCDVRIHDNNDLAAFVSHLVALSEDPAAWTQVKSGTINFSLFQEPGKTQVTLGTAAAKAVPPVSPETIERVEKGVVNEAAVDRFAQKGVTRLVLDRSAVLTPLARDRARQLKIQIERVKQ